MVRKSVWKSDGGKKVKIRSRDKKRIEVWKEKDGVTSKMKGEKKGLKRERKYALVLWDPMLCG